MAHRVWATGEGGGSFEVGTDTSDEAYVQISGLPKFISVVPGQVVRWAAGLDSATPSSPAFTSKTFMPGTYSFLADGPGGAINVA